MNRPFDKRKVIYSLLISTGIFVIIFFISYSVSYSKLQGIFSDQQSTLYKILGTTTEEQLLGTSCENSSLGLLSQELDNMGNVISILENRLGKTNSQVTESKKLYSMLEVQHFVDILKNNKACNESINTILFFYSNSKESKDKGQRMGFILSALKNEFPNRVMIYSFDSDLKIPIINTLKQKYNVTGPNEIVINENTLLADVSNENQIIPYLMNITPS